MRYSIFLFVAAFAAPAMPVVPIGPIPVTGTRTTINNGPGDQADPHISGDLACYVNAITPGFAALRYYNFATAVDSAIPSDASLNDILPDVSGNRIAFTRILPDRNAIEVFDTVTSTLTEIAPQAGTHRFGSAIGNATVAYDDLATGYGVLFAFDLSAA